MAVHSSILAWRIPWTEEPGRLQSMASKDSDMTERLTTQQHTHIDCFQASAQGGKPRSQQISWAGKLVLRDREMWRGESCTENSGGLQGPTDVLSWELTRACMWGNYLASGKAPSKGSEVPSAHTGLRRTPLPTSQVRNREIHKGVSRTQGSLQPQQEGRVSSALVLPDKSEKQNLKGLNVCLQITQSTAVS